jgi:protein-S-isoprenylcysteine O-methyltransferase Ste14
MSPGDDYGQRHHGSDRRRVASYLLAAPLFFALVLILPAGTLTWMNGWIFLLGFLLAGTSAGLYVVRVNPEILTARSRVHKGTKGWDRILLGFMIPAILSIFPVAALDAGRFHWFPVPWWVLGLGYALLLAGIGITAWAQAVNEFFEPGVRIQLDRGQRVIDSGPYAVVRHPGYVAACLLFVGIALALGSLWALVPAGLASLLLIVRTLWEDRTLQAELVGYKVYTQRVRSRWIPGIW